jgi:tetratricopeptide (TPR) repeat protein
MRSNPLLPMFVLWLLWSLSSLDAQTTSDRVQRRNGIDTGSITATTPLGVTVSKGSVTSKIAAEEIRSIQFDGEPPELNAARSQFERGRYDTALERLKRIDRDKITRPEVIQESDFYIVVSEGNLALAGKSDLKQAIAEIGEFQSTHRTSFHIPEVIELHGDLYIAAKDFPAARKKYETLAKAPTDYFKARSAFLVGRLLQEQGQHVEALGHYESAISTAGAGSITADVRREAVFGKAVSLSATGKLSEGTDAVKQIILRTPADETAALAQGYNALGNCYLAGGDAKAARNAYLHVDFLFNSATNEHAEALFRLTNLWKELRQPTRAQDAQQRLGDDYPLSRWTGR